MRDLRKRQTMSNNIVKFYLSFFHIFQKFVDVFLSWCLAAFQDNAFVEELTHGKIIISSRVHTQDRHGASSSDRVAQARLLFPKRATHLAKNVP